MQIARSALLALTALSLSIGCGTTREAEYDDTDATAEADPAQTEAATPLVDEGDAAWTERDDMAKHETALAKWAEAVAAAPNADVYLKLGRGHYFMAERYAHEGNEAKRDEHYTAGLKFSEKAVAKLAPDFVAGLKAGDEVAAALKKAPPEAAPAFYWEATNLGKWAATKGFATVLKYKDDVKTKMDWVRANNNEYFYGGPPRYFGAFEAATSGMLGGSLEKSKANFEESISIEPNYLGTKVLFAEYYCEKAQDKDLFKKLLEEVIAADPGANPELLAENKLEQAKAEKLLSLIDDKF